MHIVVVGSYVVVAIAVGIVEVGVIDGTGRSFAVDMLMPVLDVSAGAIVGRYGGIVRRHHISGQLLIVGVEVPHDELGLRSGVGARLGVEVQGVAWAEVHARQLVYGVALGAHGPLVYVVVFGTFEHGADVAHAAVYPYARCNLHALEVAAHHGMDGVVGVGPAGTHGVIPPGAAVVTVARGVGQCRGFGPIGHRVVDAVVYQYAEVDVLIQLAFAGGVGGGDAQVVPLAVLSRGHGFVGQQQGVGHRGGILGVARRVFECAVGQVVLYLGVAIRCDGLLQDDGLGRVAPGVGVGHQTALHAVDDAVAARGAEVRLVAEVQHVVRLQRQAVQLGVDIAVVVYWAYIAAIGSDILVAERGAAEEVGCGEVDLRVVEDAEFVVALEVLVLGDRSGQDAVVAARHRGKAYGVAVVYAGEPLAHAYLGVVAHGAADYDEVTLRVVHGLEIVASLGSVGLAGEQHIGFIPVFEGFVIDGKAYRHAIHFVDHPPGNQVGIGVHTRIHQIVFGDGYGGVSVRLRQLHGATIDIDGSAAGGSLYRYGIADCQVVVSPQSVAEVVLYGDVAVEGQRSTVGDADGAHVLCFCRHTVAVCLAGSASVAVPVVLHDGTLAQVHCAACPRHLNDGSERDIGVGQLVDGLSGICVVSELQVTAADGLCGIIINGVTIGVSATVDMLDLGTGTAME